MIRAASFSTGLSFALLPGGPPLLTGCAAAPPPHSEPWTELLPGIEADPDRRAIRFPARVAIDAHNPDTPVVFLELIACVPDTREHESLVVTDIPPSTVHAALLAIGAEPGRPGRVDFKTDGPARIPPEGEPVRVVFDVAGERVPPSAWVVNAETAEHWTPRGYVFAGSRLRTRQGRTWYDADGMGTLIGLATFGSETVAPIETISPDSGIDQPVWIADRDGIPIRGTPVTVVIERASE